MVYQLSMLGVKFIVEKFIAHLIVGLPGGLLLFVVGFYIFDSILKPYRLLIDPKVWRQWRKHLMPSKKSKWGDLGARYSPSRNAVCVHGESSGCLRCATDDENRPFPTRSLSREDIEQCVRRLPEKVRDFMLWHPEEMILAGGYLRSVIRDEPIHDIDLFLLLDTKDGLKLNAKADTLAGELAKELGTTSQMFQSPFANTLTYPGGPPVQIIWRFPEENPADVIKSFDFTICQACLWYSHDQDWRGLCVEDYYSHLAAKRLVYTNPANRDDQKAGPVGRLMRFAGEGYIMSVDGICTLVSRVVWDAKDLANTQAELKNQLYTQAAKNEFSPAFEVLSKPKPKPKEAKVERSREDWGS